MRPGLHDKKAQLFRRVTLHLCLGTDSEDREQAIRGAIENPDHRTHQPREDHQRRRYELADPFGIHERNRLGCQLAENDMKERQDKETDAQGDACMHACWSGWQPEDLHESVEDDCDRRLAHPAQRKRCQCNTQLSPGYVPVEVSQGLLDILCAALARVGHLVDPAPPNCHESEFSGDEESVDGDEQKNDSEAARDRPDPDMLGWTLKKGQEIHSHQIYLYSSGAELTESANASNLDATHRRSQIESANKEKLPTFDQRKLIRGVYIGRLTLATALFLVVVALWLRVDAVSTLIASLALVATIGFTAASYFWTDLRQKTPSATFLYLQVIFDTLLVTAAVHVTWSGGQSQLAPFYILVFAVAALLIAPAGVPLIASLGIVLYFADAMLAHGGVADVSLLIQLVIFAVVALTSAFIAARLRAAGAQHEEMAAELAEFRLKASDMRRLSVRAERLEGVAEMSASLAHEIKNPLASIRSAVEQLSRMPRASDDEKILSGLVQRESDRLARVLTEFLDFARTGVTRLETLNIADIARNAARLVSSQPGIETGVRVTEFFPAAPMQIEGDEDLIHRAVYNLLLNAAQASPANGEVRIEGGELEPHQLPAGHKAFPHGAYAIQVIDRGAGIDPQIRDRLFDPFVTTKPGGSGLGLSIVQRAVQAHGGLITVSAPGEETRFTLVIPKTG